MTDTVSGIRTFMKSPHIIPGCFPSSLAKNKLVFRGYPYDLGTTGRPGARFGPSAIRDASIMICDGPDTKNWFDAGDLPLAGKVFDVNKSLDLILHDASHIIKQGSKLMAFGGDHTITDSIIRAHLFSKKTDLVLVMFDAHADTWKKDEIETHGTWVRSLIEDNLLHPENIYMFGVRSAMPKEEKEWLRDTIPADNLFSVDNTGTSPFLNIPMDAWDKMREIPTYCTVDIDCLDPSVAPGTGTPEVCGLQISQVLNIIRNLATVKLVGADIVEVCPAYDVSQLTALAAATITWHLAIALEHANGKI